ncbi:MAG: DUF5777 family beta-barrel protein [Flavobacteriales bacterium]
MKKLSIIACILIFCAGVLWAQEKDKTEDKPKKEVKPVKHTFDSEELINVQTTEMLRKKSLQFQIQHRFGSMENGISDLYGIFGAANIRLGLNYGITDRLNVGIGGAKTKHLYDLLWKYKILRQSKSGSMPISMVYFGDAEINTMDDDNFQTLSNRMAYFHQLLIARKFSKKISFQVGASLTHHNFIDTPDSLTDLSHDNINICGAGRFNFSPQSSLILMYNHPLTPSDSVGTKPDLGLGVEISTGNHSFQIFVATAGLISYQENAVFNTNDFTAGEIMLGFNIVRKWRF